MFPPLTLNRFGGGDGGEAIRLFAHSVDFMNYEIGGQIILNWNLERQDGVVWIGTSGGFL